MDQCKLVSTTKNTCVNFYWAGSAKNDTVVDRVPDDEYVTIPVGEAVETLRIGKNGCERLCEEHAACVEIGSGCKDSGVCLNLFWKKGVPSRERMKSCYHLSDEDCDDGTPILCGPGIIASADSVTDAASMAYSASIDGTASTDMNDRNEAINHPPNLSSKASSLRMTTVTALLIIPFITWGR
jgi:hypothetical protein